MCKTKTTIRGQKDNNPPPPPPPQVQNLTSSNHSMNFRGLEVIQQKEEEDMKGSWGAYSQLGYSFLDTKLKDFAFAIFQI
jgi:hypothetical protein